jgi:hypothetical protein
MAYRDPGHASKQATAKIKLGHWRLKQDSTENFDPPSAGARGAHRTTPSLTDLRGCRRLEPFPFRLNRNGGSLSCFDAFSSREPVSTSLENALVDPQGYDGTGEARHQDAGSCDGDQVN